MKILHYFLIVLLSSGLISSPARAQDQSGFISLDCGSSANTSYTESDTFIHYTSDDDLIDKGVSGTIEPDLQSMWQRPMWNLRSFPYGIRNCYNLNLTKDDKYLIRASFLYGNYDNKMKLPKFDLHIGSNYWSTVAITNETDALFREIIYQLNSSQLHVCLVKTDSSDPFISSLELRRLNSNAYNSSGALEVSYRIDAGSLSQPFRFNYDIFDRFWLPHAEFIWSGDALYFFSSSLVSSAASYQLQIAILELMSSNFSKPSWKMLNTSDDISTSKTYQEPQLAMETAATPNNVNEPLSINVLPPYEGAEIFVYMYFCELQEMTLGDLREFSIIYNGKPWRGPVTPKYLSTSVIQSDTPLLPLDGKYEFLLQKTESSTLPPILNAMEIYTLKQLPGRETDEKDVTAVMNIKFMYKVKTISWQGDPCGPPGYMWSGLNCSFSDNAPSRITLLNLSASGLEGVIAPYISDIIQLSVLDLSNNKLEGSIPGFLSRMTSLKVINLSGNMLKAPIPAELLEKLRKGQLELSVEGNPGLCATSSCSIDREKSLLDPLLPSDIERKKSLLVPILASATGALVLVAISVAICLYIKRRRNKTKGASTGNTVSSLTPKNRQVTFAQVKQITNNFDRVLGRGGFGTVFYGVLDDNQVAVKLLTTASDHGFKQFKAEVDLLLRVHHINLVSLLGFCDEGDNMALVYEFMANGDLRDHLSGKLGSGTLSWETRLKIAREAAQGLEYLHHGCKPPIIHRDVKTTNILLDEHFQAKLADFGLSRPFPAGGESHVSTVIAGTPGYLDPEYYKTNWLTEKSDVFSFGIVILEIITSNPVIDMDRGWPHITDWVSSMVENGDINSVVDAKLHGEFDTNSIWKAVETALSCADPTASRRPSMSHVITELNECLALEAARIQGRSEAENSKGSVEVSVNFDNPGAR